LTLEAGFSTISIWTLRGLLKDTLAGHVYPSCFLP
jgi:hypothetical protein